MRSASVFMVAPGYGCTAVDLSGGCDGSVVRVRPVALRRHDAGHGEDGDQGGGDPHPAAGTEVAAPRVDRGEVGDVDERLGACAEVLQLLLTHRSLLASELLGQGRAATHQP